MTDDGRPRPFQFESEVPAGDKRHFRYEVSETYLGDPVEIPVTIINGIHDGPRVFFTAALHGDELNGVKVAQEIAHRYEPSDIHGTLVVIHVANIPGYLAQERYIPIYDQDLNRSFPGREGSNTAGRIAHHIYRPFIAQCDLGIDFHTSTRNRTTMFHVRADMARPEVESLASAFGANLILDGPGEGSSLRAVATNDGIPTITVEMGKAHRFEPPLIERALDGVESVLAAEEVLPDTAVDWAGWNKVIPADIGEKTWIRSAEGGLVEMNWGPSPVVEADEAICTISNHFKTEERTIRAPYTGIIVGFLENPVALPGHPLCHLVRIDEETREEIDNQIESGDLNGYRMWGKKLATIEEEEE